MSGHSKWATTKHKKAVIDAKRGKMFAKLIKNIEVAARMGGGDPAGNPTLYDAIQKAKKSSVPNDNIDRAVKRGSGAEAGGADYQTIMYEGYGPNGVALLIECLTDNKNRAAMEVRTAISRNGGNLADPGSVSYMFNRKGVVIVAKEQDGKQVEEDDVLEATLDAGAEEVNDIGEAFEVISEATDLVAVRTALQAAGIDYDSAEAGQPDYHTAFELSSPGTAVCVDAHRFALGAMAPGVRLKRRVTDAVWERARKRVWEGVPVWEMDPVDALLVGLVLGRAWGADGWGVKAHDALDWRLLRDGTGMGDGELEARSRELGCARTLRLFRERFDPDRGTLELGRPPRAWVRRARALSSVECFQLGATLRRAANVPGIVADVAATLPYVYRARRAVRGSPDLRELLRNPLIIGTVTGVDHTRLFDDPENGEEAAEPLVQRHTAKPEAYQKYLEGRYYWARRHTGAFQNAIECFTAATVIDPDYALAHAGVADAYAVLGLYGFAPVEVTGPKAVSAAERALTLDPDLAEAHAALALVMWTQQRKWHEAVPVYERALALDAVQNYGMHRLAEDAWDDFAAAARAMPASESPCTRPETDMRPDVCRLSKSPQSRMARGMPSPGVPSSCTTEPGRLDSAVRMKRPTVWSNSRPPCASVRLASTGTDTDAVNVRYSSRDVSASAKITSAPTAT